MAAQETINGHNSGRKTAAHFCWNWLFLPQFRTQNRCALLLELAFPPAIPDAKPLRTFAGIGFFLPQFRTQNRYALLLELL